jgi:hypothetical protein
MQTVTLNEEHRLRMSDNKVPRRIFGSKREDVREGWETCLHDWKLQNLYSSPNFIRVIRERIVRWSVYVARMEIRHLQNFSRKI